MGIWTNYSDKHSKTAFAPIDPQAILAKVVALPVTTWQYKTEKAEVRHLGPMAQDFHAAFKLGADDKAIGTLDEAGVALAAIQGLNHKLEQENAKLKAKSTKLEAKSTKLEAENTTIKARLAALEKQMATHTRTQARLDALEAHFERLFQARAE